LQITLEIKLIPEVFLVFLIDIICGINEKQQNRKDTNPIMILTINN